MNKYKINNIRIDIPESMHEMQQVMSNLLDGEKNVISFINPEIFMLAEKNPFLCKYLDETKYNFVDGVGLLKAVNYLYAGEKYTIRDRYPGTDFFLYLKKSRKWRVFLFGSSHNNNVLASQRIQKKYSNVEIVGNIDGYTDLNDEDIVVKINESNPDILIVCLGCPLQENWISKNKDKLNVQIIFGNGGSIDFWSENTKRAPKFLINHNMEWLYRLFQDFSYKRLRRQAKLSLFLKNVLIRKYNVERCN